MRQQQQRCFYCNEPATLLCDFKLGRPVFDRGEDGKPRPWFTCDLSTCRTHAKQVGGMHVRLSQRVNGRRGYFDTFDHCLEHSGQSEAVPTPRITESEAERLRRVVRERAQRRALESGVLPPPISTADQGELF